MKKILFVVLAILLLASACMPGAKAILTGNPGVLRDTIFSIEPRANGTTVVWMTHDDLGSYCTKDPAIVKAATAIINDKTRPAEVILTYASINAGDSENGGIFDLGSTGCPADRGEGNGNVVYKVVSVVPVDYKSSGE